MNFFSLMSNLDCRRIVANIKACCLPCRSGRDDWAEEFLDDGLKAPQAVVGKSYSARPAGAGLMVGDSMPSLYDGLQPSGGRPPTESLV